jgi:UDP-N-acetylmuramyl pentapeptide phosphotransferase/UDP-N-acetylglucosamine-1-phosphate transferase
MLYLAVTLLFFAFMRIYFRVAVKFSIIDMPNARSSHNKFTIRGGGILFLLAIIISGIMHPEYSLVVFGATLIGVISFLDDSIDLSTRIRIVFHLLAVSILFYSLPIFGFIPWWGIIGLYILVIGIINAYNFMDGINGITGLYSLIVLGGLQYVNLMQISFIEPDLIWLPMISCFVFLFFNFRKKAICFAGDVGSVTIAFWIIMLLLKLILETGNWTYVLFLAVYGVDTILTIVHRLFLRENIFEAHRLHFYQIMANEQKMSHLLVATIYAIIQILIICFILSSKLSPITIFLISTIPLVLIYVVLKPRLMKGHLN